MLTTHSCEEIAGAGGTTLGLIKRLHIITTLFNISLVIFAHRLVLTSLVLGVGGTRCTTLFFHKVMVLPNSTTLLCVVITSGVLPVIMVVHPTTKFMAETIGLGATLLWIIFVIIWGALTFTWGVRAGVTLGLVPIMPIRATLFNNVNTTG